jgi:hypothetical protein
LRPADLAATAAAIEAGGQRRCRSTSATRIASRPALPLRSRIPHAFPRHSQLSGPRAPFCGPTRFTRLSWNAGGSNSSLSGITRIRCNRVRKPKWQPRNGWFL